MHGQLIVLLIATKLLWSVSRSHEIHVAALEQSVHPVGQIEQTIN
jgi:hypothetical protein